jgi:hypothetical protein
MSLRLAITFLFLWFTFFQHVKAQNTISASDIQGSWTCIKIIPSSVPRPILIPEVVLDGFEEPSEIVLKPPVYKPGTIYNEYDTYLFKGDSVWVFNYPCQLRAQYSYSLKEDSITFIHRYGEDSRKITLFNGTLTIGGDTTRHVAKYVKKTLDKEIVRMLQKDSTNPKCLYGKWRCGPPKEGWYKDLVGKLYPHIPTENITINRSTIIKGKRKQFGFIVDGKKWIYSYNLRPILGKDYDWVLELQLLNWKTDSGEPLTLLYRPVSN